MEPGNLALKSPKELQNNTSVITMLLYVLYGLMVHLAWPFFVGYILAFLLIVNLALIGKLFYEIESEKWDINIPRNRFFALFRAVINLVLMFLVFYYIEVI